VGDANGGPLMAAGDLITTDWQVEYQGLLTGGDTAYSLVQVEGLAGMPPVRSSDLALMRRHGAHPGDDFLDVRQVVLTYEIYAADNTAFAAAVEALQSAFRPGGAEAALVFQIPGLADNAKGLVWCRPRRRQLPVNLEWYHRIPIATIELVATDPAVYANTESGGSSTLPSAGGGMTFPETPPITFGAVSTGGTITAVNGGSFATDVTFRIDGPADNPRIESLTAGQTIAVNISLAAGEYLLIDTKSRTVLLGGTTSRYSLLDSTSRWFTLAPGSNEITFRATTSTAATLTARWRSAWA